MARRIVCEDCGYPFSEARYGSFEEYEWVEHPYGSSEDYQLETAVPLVHPKQNTLSNMVGAACFVILFIVFIALVLITLYNKLSS